MMARNRRYGRNRGSVLKTRVGVAAAVVLGSGAIAGVALATTSHNSPIAAAPAAHTSRFGNEGTMNEGTMLASVLANWGSSRQNSYSQLAQMTTMRNYSQTSHQGRTLDVQRGIVVLATRQFIILQSSNGSLHLWLVSGATKFQNVSNTTAGTAAMTGNTSATQQAMQSGNMVPATTLLAGSPTTAATMLTPATTPETVTVQVAGTDLTVTVTVTRSTATVNQTATTPMNAMPTSMPSTYTMNAWQATNSLARGDLAVIAGTRSHHMLHAQLVLFSPLSTSMIGGTTGGTTGTTTGTTGTTTGSTLGGNGLTATPAATPTHW